MLLMIIISPTNLHTLHSLFRSVTEEEVFTRNSNAKASFHASPNIPQSQTTTTHNSPPPQSDLHELFLVYSLSTDHTSPSSLTQEIVQSLSLYFALGCCCVKKKLSYHVDDETVQLVLRIIITHLKNQIINNRKIPLSNTKWI